MGWYFVPEYQVTLQMKRELDLYPLIKIDIQSYIGRRHVVGKSVCSLQAVISKPDDGPRHGYLARIRPIEVENTAEYFHLKMSIN